MIRALLFDMDGVLIDSKAVWFHLMNALSKEHGYPPITWADLEASWGQGIQVDVENYFSRSTVGEVESYFQAHFMDYREHLIVTEGAPELLDELARRGLGTAVVTNTPGKLAQNILDHAGLRVPHVVGGTDVPSPKPAPDMVVRACELLSRDPSETAVVGDSRYDRAAAEAAGARFIGFRMDGETRVEELSQILELIS